MIIKNLNIQNKRNNEAIREVPKASLEIAKGMEKQFNMYMIEQMNKTIGSSRKKSVSLEFYKSMLNGYYSDIMSEKNGGLGIQKIILKQIYFDRKENFGKMSSKHRRRY
ncbi:MAG: hypothetical protein OXB88_09340 [Bacteriovoracales bacterium]|nr:hypothetical protein [Bacteriovoracales bacterium]